MIGTRDLRWASSDDAARHFPVAVKFMSSHACWRDIAACFGPHYSADGHLFRWQKLHKKRKEDDMRLTTDMLRLR